MEQRINNDGAAKKYFHIMLNLADDELNPFQYRLLGHYVRVGECTEGTRTTAKITKMSVGMVVKTRRELAQMGYIALTEPKSDTDTVHVTIVDRWAENIANYAQPVHQVNTPVHGVNKRRTDTTNVVSTAPTRKPDALFDAFMEVCKLDPKTAGSFIGKYKTVVKAAGYTPEDVKRFGEIWYTREYPGGAKDNKPPSAASVAKYIQWVREIPSEDQGVVVEYADALREALANV